MIRHNEQGGVSLFVVIFTALLITVITVGFTRFVINNQQQTINNDLSDRAYNSALAGVEDAKRVLIAYTKECAADPSGVPCSQLTTAINALECDTIKQAGITSTSTTDGAGNDEHTVGDNADNQAYTCVKIVLNTDDYTGSVEKDGSSVVHLKGVSSFDEVKITWFSKSDSGSTDPNVDLYDVNPLELPPATDWPASAPPIMRAQYIPASVNIEDLDDEARTVFLYPSSGAIGTNLNLGDDARRASGAKVLSPYPASCSATYASSGGVCTRTLALPAATSNAYLQLSALYNDTSYSIELYSGGSLVQFDGVAPQVDSTGRADSLLRRVDARVKVGGVELPYPIAALYTEGNLCKDFTLKDSYNAYNAGSCSP